MYWSVVHSQMFTNLLNSAFQQTWCRRQDTSSMHCYGIMSLAPSSVEILNSRCPYDSTLAHIGSNDEETFLRDRINEGSVNFYLLATLLLKADFFLVSGNIYVLGLRNDVPSCEQVDFQSDLLNTQSCDSANHFLCEAESMCQL